MGEKKEKEATFHGGFVRDRGEGRGVRVSTVKSEDLSPIDPGASISPKLAGFGAKARKTKLAVMGLSTDLLDAGDPRYAACIRLANAFRKARTKEMYGYHGHVSSGVSALLAASAMALAASRFCYEVAASAESGIRPDLLSKAAKLSDSARQNELSAWELCARESQVRRRNESNSVSSPWFIGPSGTESKKPGRKRKLELAETTYEPQRGEETITNAQPNTIGETEGGGAGGNEEDVPGGGEGPGGRQ